jgi:hypothetical protein
MQHSTHEQCPCRLRPSLWLPIGKLLHCGCSMLSKIQLMPHLQTAYSTEDVILADCWQVAATWPANGAPTKTFTNSGFISADHVLTLCSL